MGFSSFNQQNKTMDDNDYDDEEEGLDSFLSNSSCDDISSVGSSESDPVEDQEVNSSLTKTSPDSDSDSEKIGNGALGDMSSLVQQLPFKRGLSKHFQGKSQSFTSLSNVLYVEDLAKPENPYNKKLKSCKSYGGLLLLSSSDNNSTKNKKINNNKKGSSKGSCSSLMSARRNNMSFLGNNNSPPPPHRSASTNNFSNQTPLFA